MIMLSSLAFLAGCGEDSPVNEQENLVFYFNKVLIEEVGDASADGLRTITMSFEDKSGNKMMMYAGSCYKSLETGWYNITSEVGKRLDAKLELTSGDKTLNITGGKLRIWKKNYEYSMQFDLTLENGTAVASIKNKNLYFESEKYSSYSEGGDGFFLKDQTISSEVLNAVMKYSIYLPEGYDESKKYPVLYILHGMYGNNNDWLQNNYNLFTGGGTMPAYAKEFVENGGKEIIIVSPEGRNLFYCNGFENGMNYMTYFFDEFVPHIESTYSIKAERSSRAIGGLSMGGYGSLYYGLLHPEMFCYVYACSSAISVGGAAPELKQFLAAAANEERIADLPGLTLEIGTEDSLFPNNEEFIRTLDGYGIPYEYITRSGAHDWKFWNACSPKIIQKVCAIFE